MCFDNMHIQTNFYKNKLFAYDFGLAGQTLWLFASFPMIVVKYPFLAPAAEWPHSFYNSDSSVLFDHVVDRTCQVDILGADHPGNPILGKDTACVSLYLYVCKHMAREVTGT